MSVTREHVLEVAALARLHLTDAEVALFASQLADILAHVEELESASGTADDADDADDAATVQRAPLRGDEPPPDALEQPPSAIAPVWRDGFFTVPRLDAMNPGSAAEPS